MTDPTLPPAPPPAAPAKPGRGLRIALAVSLALNLGVAGLVGGMILHGGPRMHGDMVRDMGFGPFDEVLRPEDRDALRKGLQQRAGDLAALRADPFDPAGLTAALDGQRQHLADRLSLGSGLIRDFLLALPQEDRLDFADRLEARMKHGRDAPPKPGN
jgi:hypothetical protein